MEIIKKKKRNDVHPYIPELKMLYRGGRITRREFLRNATMLGLSLTSASAFLSACAGEEEATATSPPPTKAPEPTKTPQPTKAPEPTALPADFPKRGGTLRVEWPWIPYVEEPAKDGVGTSEIGRCTAETLVRLDEEFVLYPLLAERWEANEDASEWTFFLQKGVKFNNGKDFTADDVVWNIQHWLDPDTASPMGDALSALSSTGVEKVDDHTVKLHLDKPSIAIPYHLWNYPALILPEGGCAFYDGEAIGTGPYLMKEFIPDERAEFERREGYWQNGEDGKPLPYLDGIRFVAGLDGPSRLAAITQDEIDIIYSPSDATMAELEKRSGIVIEVKASTSCDVIRVRCDQPPFDDPNVRNALKWVQDRERLRELANAGRGELAWDHWVSPFEGGYYPLEDRPQDIAKSKALLAEAGYPDGLEIEMTLEEAVSVTAEVLKEMAIQAGININLKTVPSSLFWDQWDQWPFSITGWNGRVAFGNLELGCRCGAVWNEMHWCNEEFDAALDRVLATADVEERRKHVRTVEEIMQEDSGMLLPFWSWTSGAHRSAVHNYTKHISPHYYLLYVWLA